MKGQGLASLGEASFGGGGFQKVAWANTTTALPPAEGESHLCPTVENPQLLRQRVSSCPAVPICA